MSAGEIQIRVKMPYTSNTMLAYAYYPGRGVEATGSEPQSTSDGEESVRQPGNRSTITHPAKLVQRAPVASRPSIPTEERASDTREAKRLVVCEWEILCSSEKKPYTSDRGYRTFPRLSGCRGDRASVASRPSIPRPKSGATGTERATFSSGKALHVEGRETEKTKRGRKRPTHEEDD